jgi:hypothetical protein
VKEKGNESCVTEYFFDRRLQWTKQQSIAWNYLGWQRSVFSARMKVALTEDDGIEVTNVHRVQRRTSGKSYFDLSPGSLVHASETSRESSGVICYDEIVGSQKLDERAARNVNNVSLRINHEKLCVRWTLYC